MAAEHISYAIERLLQRGGLRPYLGTGVGPELELDVGIAQVIGNEGHAAHGHAACQHHVECPAGGAPEIDVEGPGWQADGALGRGIVDVTHRHQ